MNQTTDLFRLQRTPAELADADVGTPLRVLHLYWSGTRNGVTIQLAALVRNLRGTNHSHSICFFDGRGVVADELVLEGLAVRLGMKRGWDFVRLLRLARTLRRMRPDIVHVHKPALLPTLVGYLAWSRARWVCTEHSPDSLTRGPRFRLFYALFRSRFARFVALNPTLDALLRGYGVPEDRIVEIPCALTIPLRQPNGVPQRRATIGALARLAEVKRLDLFIDVVALLRSRGFECKGRIIGDGPERGTLEQYAVRRGLVGAIEFAGETADVPAALDELDLLLFTSSAEVSGGAALEAMGRGVPVVAMPCRGGLGDLVREGGRVVSDRSPEAAAAAVERLLRSPEERAEFQRRGYTVARAHTFEALLPKLFDLYEQAMGIRGSH